MQLAITDPNGPLTMTSREIAELTGKELSNVHRDIRTMLDELKKDDSTLNHPREDKDARGYVTCYHLSRELTETLLTGYSAVSRLKVIRRWHELEDQLRKPEAIAANYSRMELLEMAMAAEKERLQLSNKVAELEPKAKALDTIATFSEGSMCITDAAKSIQQKPTVLFKWLSEHAWIYRRAGGKSWVAYQDRIQSGVLEHKISTVERGDGSTKIACDVLVTAKGLARLAEKFGATAPLFA